jgi:Abortive infection C-terminus
MADLLFIEKRKLEQLFGMSSGYVLDFSNRTFAEFFADTLRVNIFDEKYSAASGSKANRLRAFWTAEPNYRVGKLLSALIEHARHLGTTPNEPALYRECQQIASRLVQGSPLDGLEAFPAEDEPDFEVLAGQVRDVIEKNQPEAGLDRLHTFTVKFVRSLCRARGIEVGRDKPLHSIFGEYVKKLNEAGQVESHMGLRILKSSISVLEAFNDVRNEQSLAHDNPILSRDESLLIFNHVAATTRFLRDLEARIAKANAPPPPEPAPLADDEIPF